MSTQSIVQSVSRIAGADLSALQFYFVKWSGANAVVGSVQGESVLGVLQNKPKSGQVATIDVMGLTQVIAGGTIAAGAPVTVDANGKAISASLSSTDTTAGSDSVTTPLKGDNVVGRAMESAVAGDIFQMMFTREGAIPTTLL